MYRSTVRIFLALVLSVVLSAGIAAQDSGPLGDVTRGNNALAVSLYHSFAEENDSFIFSPYSVYTLLALLYGGARGETADQVLRALNVRARDQALHDSLIRLQAGLAERGSSGPIELVIANALWPLDQYPFLPEYIDLAQEYGAELAPIDYRTDANRAREIINNWAAEKTNNRITDLLADPPYPTTVLIAANAIYFKGDWESKFDEANTTDEQFHGSAADSIVPMMYQEQEFRYGEHEYAQILEMPYLGKELSMVVVLPSEGYTLADIESELTADTLQTHTTDLWTVIAETYLPRFVIQSEFDLKATLRDLGVTNVFEPGLADLSGIDGVPHWLYIGFALQKAFVRVSEEGSEAAAVTVGGGCFPAGTLVQTVNGTQPIEEVSAGTRVASYDLQTRRWTWAEVTGRSETLFDGDMVTIETGGASVEATGNHPFYVLSGTELEGRPIAGDVPAAERRGGSGGRWVAARDLRRGDILLSRAGRIVVASTSPRQVAGEVFNLAVAGRHNYAVGRAGFLVHNKGSAEPERVVFRADRPFIYLIRDKPTGTILFMGRVDNL